MLDMYYELRFAAVTACHFKVKKLSVRTVVKKEKEIHEAIAAAMPAGVKTLYFLQNTFLCCIENLVFMWGLNCYEKGVHID